MYSNYLVESYQQVKFVFSLASGLITNGLNTVSFVIDPTRGQQKKRNSNHKLSLLIYVQQGSTKFMDL